MDHKRYLHSKQHSLENDSSVSDRRKKGRQSNHEEYLVPVSVLPWAKEPLYMLISRWSMHQERWVNRNDIAEAFHIPPRRASYQLAYISRKKDKVECRIRTNHAEDNHHRRSEIWVDRILAEPPPEAISPANKPTVTVSRNATLTSRGVGSGMADNLGLWERMLKGIRGGSDDE